MKFKKNFVSFLATLAITCSCGICAADNFNVINAEPNAVFFYMDKTAHTFSKPNAYNVRFSIVPRSNKLYIEDALNGTTIFQLQPYEDAGVSYDVKEIPVFEPRSGLFAISATAGAHAQNLGYWLIGVTDGKWKIYVDYKKLAQKGFKPDQWNRLYGQFDGMYSNFVITSTTEYMPPWGQYGADLIDWPTGKWVCQWSDKAQDMLLKPVEVQRPAFIASQDQAMIYMDQWLRNHPQYRHTMQGAKLSYSRHNPNPNDGLENHEIKIIEDHPTHIATRATFIINECADILYYDVVKDKYTKVQ